MKAVGLRRAVGGLVVLVLAAGLMSACRTNVGAAAYVGSNRISESEVSGYVTREAKLTTDSNGQVVNPKSDALTWIILDNLFDRVFRDLPTGLPSEARLTETRQDLLDGQNLTFDALVAGQATEGFTRAYTDLYLTAQAKVALLREDLKDPGDTSAVVAALQKLPVKISANPRYGNWDITALRVLPGPDIPPFLRLEGTSAAEPTANGAGG